jgi:hypothetical protein
VLERDIGISRARGRKYRKLGATVIPTFHPAAALRGGRFGGMSPIDALRADFQVVKAVLDEPPEVRLEPAAVQTADSEQLGLF